MFCLCPCALSIGGKMHRCHHSPATSPPTHPLPRLGSVQLPRDSKLPPAPNKLAVLTWRQQKSNGMSSTKPSAYLRPQIIFVPETIPTPGVLHPVHSALLGELSPLSQNHSFLHLLVLALIIGPCPIHQKYKTPQPVSTLSLQSAGLLA